MKRIAIAAGFVVSGLTCAGAQGQTSTAYAACMDKAGGATFAMQECISGELERQDSRLNAAYKVLMASVGDKRKTQLRDAQRKWVAFRDANCGFYFDPAGGQADRLAANECVVIHTAQRASELENLKQ